MPTIKQLHVFASIARHENLGDAATEVSLSKGAVSQALAELEQRLGTRLFDRVHPRLRLNDQGKQLQIMAEDILDRVDHVRHMFDHGGEPTGSLRIGASQTIGNYLLPSLLAKVSGLEAKVEIANTHDLCEKLGHFELDLALIEGRNHHPDLVTEDWLRDEMLLVCAPDHPLAEKGKVAWTDLSGFDWVLREQHSGSRAQFDREIAPHLSSSGRILELNSIEALILSVEKGLGLTFVSKLAVQNRLSQGSLISLDAGSQFERTLSFVWHRQKYHGAMMDHFVKTLQRQSPPA